MNASSFFFFNGAFDFVLNKKRCRGSDLLLPFGRFNYDSS